MKISSKLHCLVFNSQSICNKCPEVMEHVVDNDADIVFLSETWLRSMKNEVTGAVKEYGYTLRHTTRKGRKKEIGGGVGILHKSSLNVKPVKVNSYQTFEHCVVKVEVEDGKWSTYISIYRLDYEPIELFFTEFTELLELFLVANGECIIAGDINIHCDVSDDPHTIQFNELLSAFNLKQSIDVPTHRKGHTLDVVVTHTEETDISDIAVNDISLSDHFLLSFNINRAAPQSFYKTITYRKKVSKDDFQEDLKTVLENLEVHEDFKKTITEYNESLTKLIQKHYSEVTREVKIVENAPWFDFEYKELRKKRRKAEKVYQRSRKLEDKDTFKLLRKQTTELASGKMREYYK